VPKTEVRAFREATGAIPVQDWLEQLAVREPAAFEKCLARIIELADKGNQLRRPIADYLRDGIYELRATSRGIHYRILYFFHGSHAAMLSHGTTKEGAVEKKDIELAIKRKQLVQANPSRYTAEFDA
jgi:hypothetical protein